MAPRITETERNGGKFPPVYSLLPVSLMCAVDAASCAISVTVSSCVVKVNGTPVQRALARVSVHRSRVRYRKGGARDQAGPRGL